jgi:hypothetical protein
MVLTLIAVALGFAACAAAAAVRIIVATSPHEFARHEPKGESSHVSLAPLYFAGC